MKNIRKRCHICGRWYRPHARAYRQQAACAREACQKERKRQANRRWRKLNGGYGKGRRQKVKAWAHAYPNYWQGYRASHPDYVERDNERRRRSHARGRRAAKQDGIRAQTLDKLRVLAGWTALLIQESAAKQDAIPPANPCEERVWQVMEGVVAYLIWKEGAAKQDGIANDASGERCYAYASRHLGRDQATEPG
jgi:hypothetical protein